MISIERQVCNLELSKRLKELGVEQRSYFSWEQTANTWYLDVRNQAGWEFLDKYPEHKENVIAAFTVAELGEMLILPNTHTHLDIYRSELGYFGIEIKDTVTRAQLMPDEIPYTEADARAMLLISLIEWKNKGREIVDFEKYWRSSSSVES